MSFERLEIVKLLGMTGCLPSMMFILAIYYHDGCTRAFAVALSANHYDGRLPAAAAALFF